MTTHLCADRTSLGPETTISIHNGGLVIFHAPTGRIFTSNEVGARIWRGLEQKLPLKAIVAEIICDYGINRETAWKDLVRFLTELERSGLVERGVEE